MRKDKQSILQKIHAGQNSQILHTALKLKLFDNIAADKSINEIATIKSVSPHNIQRILFALQSLKLVDMHSDYPKLTTEGHYLTSNHEDQLFPIALYKTSQLFIKPYLHLYEAIKNNTSAFKLAFGMSLYEHLEHHSDDHAMFHQAMKAYSQKANKSLYQALYLPQNIHSIVDIGGGLGELIMTFVGKGYKRLALFETSSTVKLAKKHLPSDIDLIEGDFFQKVPKGFDLYLLKNVLHNWSDEQCSKILTNLHNSCSSSNTIAIIETMAKRNLSSSLGKFSDLTMLTQCFLGKERSVEDYKKLLTNNHFILEDVHLNKSSSKTILIARKKAN